MQMGEINTCETARVCRCEGFSSNDCAAAGQKESSLLHSRAFQEGCGCVASLEYCHPISPA